MGPFFRRFADDLRQRGARVTRVVFNAGDALFHRGEGVIAYRGSADEWPSYFRDLLDRDPADAIFLFGDCRPLHVSATRVARELGTPVWVFEEGYLRPDFVTLERGGVNGNSSMSRDPDYYRRRAAALPRAPKTMPVGASFRYAAFHAIVYAMALTLGGWRYPRYRHHRNLNAFVQAFCWVRGGLRKLWYAAKETGLLERATSEWSGRYFLVPLQVHCDGQIGHSPFTSVTAFLEEVVRTFSGAASSDELLIIKHHPQDRAYRDYTRLVAELGRRYGCGERLVYVHDLHLPTLFRHARGTVTMNSTAGLSSLYHKTPTIVLGTAVYDLPGLTCQRDLADFFADPGGVDSELFAAFRRTLLADNQINGNFHRRLPGAASACGLALPEPSAAIPSDAPIPRSA